MYRVVCVAAVLLILPCQAEARHHRATPVHHAYSHHFYSHHTYAHHSYSRRAYLHRGYDLQNFRQAWAMASPGNEERVVGSRPYGCPNAFCGCEASLYKFGRIIPELNLAANWRRFPRAAPAPGMAAVRSGHVMILQSQASANTWYVHDGNSGGHVTREHPRSIAGYTIVDPSAASGRFM
jgi:hypothetical protein